MTKLRLSFNTAGNEHRLSRRRFLATGARFALMACGCQLFPGAWTVSAESDDPPEARYWAGSVGGKADCLACHAASEILPDKQYHQKQPIVKCLLCAHRVILFQSH